MRGKDHERRNARRPRRSHSSNPQETAMSDEFDDAVDPIAISATPGLPGAAGEGRAARLMARLYGSANLALRTRLVACLLRPLGSLGVAAVAAGAFIVVL